MVVALCVTIVRLTGAKVVDEILYCLLLPQLGVMLYCLHCVGSHTGISKGNVKFISNQLDVLLRPTLPSSAKDSRKEARSNVAVDGLPVYGTGEEQQTSIIASCDSLAKLLRSAVASSSELPLSITSVHGVSPAFRFAEVTLLHCVQEKTGPHHTIYHSVAR